MNTEQTVKCPTRLVHPWESAGLGQWPYRFVGSTREVYQAIPGDPGCPIQPGTSCDYCGQGISQAYHVVSADDRRFKVGCDCISRAWETIDNSDLPHQDRVLLDKVRREVRRVERNKRHAREAARIEKGRALLADGAVRAALAAEPHPISHMADRGLTRLDWAEWMFENAGNAGKIKVSRFLTQLKLGK